MDGAADAVREIPTNDIEQATALLSLAACDASSYDVLICFSHRIPDPDGGKPRSPTERQDDFIAAVSAFLASGGGMVAFHHGSYNASGKTGILELIEATAGGAVPWDTVDGQNVIDTAVGHFVTTNGVTYGGSIAYVDAGRGVPPATYPFFNNTPDRGFVYNFGRGMSAFSTPLVGYLSSTITLGKAIGMVAIVGFAVVILVVALLPETRGKVLHADA